MTQQPNWRRIMQHGVTLAGENYREYDTPEAWTAVWALLCEAARVSEASPAPPRSGYPEKACWPDYTDEMTPWQRQMAYLRGEVDEMPTDDPEPPVPTAAEVTRADAVLDLWHKHALMPSGRPHKHKRAIYRLACGASLGQVVRMTGLPRDAVLALRKRAAQEMLRSL